MYINILYYLCTYYININYVILKIIELLQYKMKLIIYYITIQNMYE